MRLIILSLMMISGVVSAATGVGKTEPFDTIKITSGVDGEVVYYDKEIGEVLSSDKVLVKLDDETKKIQRDMAKVSLDQSIVDQSHFMKKVKRYKELLQQKNFSELEYDDIVYQASTANNDVKLKGLELKSKEKDLSDTQIYGVNEYIVSKRNIEVGDYVQSSTVLYEAIDIRSLKVRMLVDDKQVKLLEIGKEVSISIYEDDKNIVKGIITNIGLEMEEGTYAYPVLIKIENEDKNISISKTVFVEF